MIRCMALNKCFEMFRRKSDKVELVRCYLVKERVKKKKETNCSLI